MSMFRIPTSALLAGAGALLAVSAATVGAQSVPTIGQKNRAFSEELVTIGTGGQVRFVNDDTVAHNVFARDPAGANRPGVLQRPGEQTDLTFAAAGDHQVLCAIHPRMRMTVRVR